MDVYLHGDWFPQQRPTPWEIDIRCTQGHYSSTNGCVHNVKELIGDGYDLFLRMNSVVLVYDEIPPRYFNIVRSYPHLTNVFKPSVVHSVPREVISGAWRQGVSEVQKYTEHLH